MNILCLYVVFHVYTNCRPSGMVALIAVPLGLSSNPEGSIDVFKCIVSLRHGNTLNFRRAASPLVRLLEEEERLEASEHTQGVLPQNWDETQPQIVVSPAWCSKLRKTTGVNW
ncbi:uncharacterized protein TNCV_4566211 [Trichonephila clavipes]|nr:uncharacterized protein TNCV_4566211 [Trichonephila clavipes]